MSFLIDDLNKRVVLQRNEVVMLDELFERWPNASMRELYYCVGSKGLRAYDIIKEDGENLYCIPYRCELFVTTPKGYRLNFIEIERRCVNIVFKLCDVISIEKQFPDFIISIGDINYFESISIDDYDMEQPTEIVGYWESLDDSISGSNGVFLSDITTLESRTAKAVERKGIKTAQSWENYLSTAVKLAVYCFEQYKKTGKPITKAEYETERKRLGLSSMADKAERAFRRSMPPGVLEKGGQN